MITMLTHRSACAPNCWFQPSTAATQQLVRRINPDWVGCLEVQCGSRSVDHHFCWWFAVAFISFYISYSSIPMWVVLDCKASYGPLSIRSFHYMPKQLFLSLPPTSPSCSCEEYILTTHKLAHYLCDMHALSLNCQHCCRSNATRFTVLVIDATDNVYHFNVASWTENADVKFWPLCVVHKSCICRITTTCRL